jgi:hypothetical protein
MTPIPARSAGSSPTTTPPYHEGDPTDGSAPMREVWDVLPLRGGDSQRWENAKFVKVPDRVVERTGLANLRPPSD